MPNSQTPRRREKVRHPQRIQDRAFDGRNKHQLECFGGGIRVIPMWSTMRQVLDEKIQAEDSQDRKWAVLATRWRKS